MPKLVYQVEIRPESQSIEAITALLKWQNRPIESLPIAVRMSDELALVRSAKGDLFYVVTPTACSCPAATYHPEKKCKHRRKYFPEILEYHDGGPEYVSPLADPRGQGSGKYVQVPDEVIEDPVLAGYDGPVTA